MELSQIQDRYSSLCGTGGPPLPHAERFISTLAASLYSQNLLSWSDVDSYAARLCADKSAQHPEFNALAVRIAVNALHSHTSASLSSTITALESVTDASGVCCSRLSPEFVQIVKRAQVDCYLQHSRDYQFTYFGFKTMCETYMLTGPSGAPIERPQHAYMRVALMLSMGQSDRKGHLADDNVFDSRLKRAIEVYELLSSHRLTHASPIMFNIGTLHPQLASCFLLSVEDCLESMLETDKNLGVLSKWAGGAGVCLSFIRKKGSLVRSTGGAAGGVRAYAAKLNSSQLYVNQGGRRPGAFALYVEIWHADIFDFLEMGRFDSFPPNAVDVKLGLWVNDMFMECLIDELQGGSKKWYLFCPLAAPGLALVHGDEFRSLYNRYVGEKRYCAAVSASSVMKAWFHTVVQKGNPYILFKDHINAKSNLSHIATIVCSNLCSEITVPAICGGASPEYGTCNLAAIPLGSFIIQSKSLDWHGLMAAAGVAVENLDNAIELCFYPDNASKRSNFRHRPLAIGVIGLADVFAELGLSFGDEMAVRLDQAIHAIIYYGAMVASSRLGRLLGNFPSFDGSAAQQGFLQPDLWVRQGHLALDWADEIESTTGGFLTSSMWSDLRNTCQSYLRNSYVTADMPTATSSQVTGQNECFEPFTSNLYTRTTRAGRYTLLNRHLCTALGSNWSTDIVDSLLQHNGSIQQLTALPPSVRRLFRTVRELDQSCLLSHAVARNPFLSQSQSLNYYFNTPNFSNVLSLLVKGWIKGITTGSYYIHFQPACGVSDDCNSCTI